MSIEQQILSLERLAVADVEITELTAGIEKERGEIAHLRDELSSLNERLEVDRVSISEMDKTRGDLIQELRQIAGQIDRSRDRLQRARNEREMNAAERELDELRKIQRDRDDEIKKLAELSEQAKVGFRESEERRAELDARLSGSLEGTTQIIAELESKLEAAQSARKEVTSGLPSLVFRRYERLHSTGKAHRQHARRHLLGLFRQAAADDVPQDVVAARFRRVPDLPSHHLLHASAQRRRAGGSRCCRRGGTECRH